MTELREMTASDRRFVVPTWALGAPWRGLTKQERFVRVDKLLSVQGARVVCLVTGETVQAWAACNGRELLYAYVPPELREHGLARRLITHLFGGYPDETTHQRVRRAAEASVARAKRKAA